MPTLICYDIQNNSLRTTLSKKLLEYGLERINLSVFLGTLKEADLRQLITLLRNLMQTRAQANDSLLILPVFPHQIAQLEVLGRNDLDLDDLSGDRHTLII